MHGRAKQRKRSISESDDGDGDCTHCPDSADGTMSSVGDTLSEGWQVTASIMLNDLMMKISDPDSDITCADEAFLADIPPGLFRSLPAVAGAKYRLVEGNTLCPKRCVKFYERANYKDRDLWFISPVKMRVMSLQNKRYTERNKR